MCRIAPAFEAFCEAVFKEFGRVDILVNCAGMTKRTPTVDLPEEEWTQDSRH